MYWPHFHCISTIILYSFIKLCFDPASLYTSIWIVFCCIIHPIRAHLVCFCFCFLLFFYDRGLTFYGLEYFKGIELQHTYMIPCLATDKIQTCNIDFEKHPVSCPCSRIIIMFANGWLNSLRPKDAYMRQLTRPSLVQTIACPLFVQRQANIWTNGDL